MPLKLLLDENLRHASLLTALESQRGQDRYPLDVARVGDLSCPPLGCDDDEIIQWAAEQDRVLLSLDARTLGRALASRLAAGEHDREEWQDAVRWIP